MTAVCECEPARLCALCESRGYEYGLAGYAERIYPERITPEDMAREDRRHIVADDPDQYAYDTCGNCGKPVIERAGALVTMLTGNPECYGERYRARC